jgi:hypothetical protein
MMSGPERLPGGRVQESRFAGRLTRRQASLSIPYHVVGAPVELRIRCHRFGLGGTLAILVNGAPVNEVAFGLDAYPWAVAVSTVPTQVAAKRPLRIDLVVRGGSAPPSHLPEDVGVGLDWVQVRPLEAGALLVPTPRDIALFAGFLLGAAGLSTTAGLRGRRLVAGVLTGAALLSVANVVGPLATRGALTWLVALPLLLAAALRGLEALYRVRPQQAQRPLPGPAAAVALAHAPSKCQPLRRGRHPLRLGRPFARG